MNQPIELGPKTLRAMGHVREGCGSHALVDPRDALEALREELANG